MNFNYQKICLDLLKDLSKRQKEIILRRFGLKPPYQKETLQAIGQDLKVSRERVRQIEGDGLGKVRPKIIKYQRVFQSFLKYFKNFGDLKREDILLEELGGKKGKTQIYFLLSLGEQFISVRETADFYSLWTVNLNSLNLAKKIIGFLSQKLKEIGKPVRLKELSSFPNFKNSILCSYLEISKKIQKTEQELYGLKYWPEINPRGIKDKSYLVFKKMGKPLHFTQVAKLIEGSLVQTVHNELIKDPRFVLIGRGIYALAEWGYMPGEIKDVIWKILKKEEPLTKEEILKKVLSQKQVKKNTVLLNLSNKKYFRRDSQGKYKIA